MVLAWHFVGAIIETDLGWWASAIRNIVIIGRTGVDLFFVLSGYLITRILLARTQRDSAFLANFLRQTDTPDFSTLLSAGRSFLECGLARYE